MKKTNVLAIILLLLSLPTWAGDLSVDNLTVSNNAAVYGKLDFYSSSSTTNGGATASGGTITTNGGYRIHTFTNVGTNNFVVSGGSLTCDVLVVAGGGAGGYWAGGGGGGGGVIITNGVVISGSEDVVVGAGGGSGVNTSGTNGQNSIFWGLTAIGGGGGSMQSFAAGNGGSGGGASYNAETAGAGTAGQGYNGGAKGYPNDPFCASGGGGAGGAGAVGTSVAGGNGGAGKESSISGTAKKYGAGGGGGTQAAPGGTGGDYGGGNGGRQSTAPSSGANGYGAGGGGRGAAGPGPGGDGGSGIVIVRYPFNSSGSSNIVSTVLTVSSNGISQTSASGSNVFMSNVGIGTDNPAEKLHVAGNLRVDGTSIVSAVTLGGEARTNWPSGAQGALMASNNLSEISSEADKAAARTNLGIGSSATNEANAYLAPAGDGSQLTNITAAQVGAVSTNDGALLAANNLSELTASAPSARTNLGLGSAATSDTSAFDPAGAATTVSNTLSAHASNANNPHQVTAAQVGALSTTGGVVNGSLSVSSNLFVNGTNVADLVGSGAFNPMITNLDMATNRIVNLAMPVEQNDAVNKYYLWSSLSNIPPMGDISMGVYTNY